ALGPQAVEELDQRHIRFRDRLEEPALLQEAVELGVPDVRQVGVEDQQKISAWHVCSVCGEEKAVRSAGASESDEGIDPALRPPGMFMMFMRSRARVSFSFESMPPTSARASRSKGSVTRSAPCCRLRNSSASSAKSGLISIGTAASRSSVVMFVTSVGLGAVSVRAPREPGLSWKNASHTQPPLPREGWVGFLTARR